MDRPIVKGYLPPALRKESAVTKRQSLKSTKGTDGAGSVPEFIQKLFRMLENKAFKNTFCWGPTGKTFIVKDTNEFSKTILPKHFKHCNFASFVRQLNKYDFHKVRNAEDAPKSYSDQAWEFVHPKFIRDRKDLLEEIRRKTPGKQKKDDMYNESEVLHTPVESCSVVDPIRNVKEMMAGLQSQIKQLEQSRTELETTLEKRQHMDRTLLNEFMQLNENMAAKDTLIQQFLQQTVVQERGHTPGTSSDAYALLMSYSEAARSNTEQLERITQLHAAQCSTPWRTPSHSPIQSHPPSALSSPDKETVLIKEEERLDPSHSGSSVERRGETADTDYTSAGTSTGTGQQALDNSGSLVKAPWKKTGDGLAFVTLGRSIQSTSNDKPSIRLTLTQPSQALETVQQKGPGWTVPPRILLVDDDSVYRDISGRLLQVIGCTIDLAKDGVEAIGKMGAEKYDLILMDIVMPNLDGISATRNIRQYDALTPIISMTSNFTDSDIMQYIGSGMTDILPKPFSKRTLYSMLEKYCAHLRAIQRGEGSVDQITAVQRGLGSLGLPLPPSLMPSIREVGESSTSAGEAAGGSPSTANPSAPFAPYPYPAINTAVEFNPGYPLPTPSTFWVSQDQQKPLPVNESVPVNGSTAANDLKFRWTGVPTAAPVYAMMTPKKRRLGENEERP